MTIISSGVLRQRLFDTVDDRYRLYVVPILDMDSQLKSGRGAIDVRLGTDFILTRRIQFSHIDPYDVTKSAEQLAADFEQYQERIHIGFGTCIILHPRQYVIGSTVEYVRLPIDLAGYVLGRSSWGRLGLVIAMATVVHPGYTGVITLELENLGEAPIALYAGARIGQLVFHEVTSNDAMTFQELYRGSKYVGIVSPGFSRVYEDSERQKIDAFGKQYQKASTFVK